MFFNNLTTIGGYRSALKWYRTLSTVGWTLQAQMMVAEKPEQSSKYTDGSPARTQDQTIATVPANRMFLSAARHSDLLHASALQCIELTAE